MRLPLLVYTWEKNFCFFRYHIVSKNSHLYKSCTQVPASIQTPLFSIVHSEKLADTTKKICTHSYEKIVKLIKYVMPTSFFFQKERFKQSPAKINFKKREKMGVARHSFLLLVIFFSCGFGAQLHLIPYATIGMYRELFENWEKRDNIFYSVWVFQERQIFIDFFLIGFSLNRFSLDCIGFCGFYFTILVYCLGFLRISHFDDQDHDHERIQFNVHSAHT